MSFAWLLMRRPLRQEPTVDLQILSGGYGMSSNDPLLIGMLELVVLELAAKKDVYAYALAREVDAATEGKVELKEGSLYPALQRLVDDGFLESREAMSEVGRRRKYYEITPAGRTALEEKRGDWFDFHAAVLGVLNASSPRNGE